jgi:hypothetical protein
MTRARTRRLGVHPRGVVEPRGRQGEEVGLDRVADVVEGQVAHVRNVERVLELGADVVEGEDRVGDQDRHERREPADLRLQGERQGGQEDHDEPADDDPVGQRQRGLADPLAAAEGVDELGAELLGLEEGEPVHAQPLRGVAEQVGEPQGHVAGHVLGRRNPRGLGVPQQRSDLRQRALIAEAVADDVGEGRRPPHQGVAPRGVVGAVGQGGDGQVPRLIDDPAP